MAAAELKQALAEARALAIAGDWDTARTQLQALVARWPDAAEGWLWLGALADDPAAAVSYLERALEIAPESRRAQRGLAWALGRLVESEPPGPGAAESTGLGWPGHDDGTIAPAAVGERSDGADSAVEPADRLVAGPGEVTRPVSQAAAARLVGPDWGVILERLQQEEDLKDPDRPALAFSAQIVENGESTEAIGRDEIGPAAEETSWEQVEPMSWMEPARPAYPTKLWRVVGWARR